ncbi:MAG: GNAT family N-acetyltransferase [Tannerella sp.]|jgi:hypothetical protein|nr:GNAT family N-acetyltransferase [Tannerella sp.]
MSKETYRALCRTEESIPLFSQDWWLDTVCGEANWEVLLIEEGRRVQAAWPLYRPCPHLVTMPPCTQTMGIWFAPFPDDMKYASALERRQSLCRQLVDRLKSRVFLQRFPYTFTDWLPFYWAGYRQTTRYTYLLHNLKDAESLWDGMNRNLRRNIRKARDTCRITVRTGIPVDDFLRMQSLTFERQHRKNRQPDGVLRRLVDVCRARQQGELWGGYDETGRLHAAAFVVWQKRSAYYLAGGGDPSLRHSGAHSLVLWEAIRFAAGRSDTFDFEGSMLPGVERFFREFGGIQTPYFSIGKGKRSLIDRIRMAVRARFGDCFLRRNDGARQVDQTLGGGGYLLSNER